VRGRWINVLAALALSAGVLCLRPASARGQAAPGAELNILGFGDWGLDSPDRVQVAGAMAAYSAQMPHPFDCALSLGDNFYVPLKSADDPQFQTLFEKTYDIARMNFPFYALLGNHDYDVLDGHTKSEWEMAYSMKNPTSRFKMPAKWYRLDLPADHPLITILMLDSNKDNGKSASLTPAEWTAELQWINTELSGPRATWTMCCAHHTVYSNGDHGDNGVLVQQWGSLFEKYKVDFYLSGHDHSLQHIEPGTFTSYVCSGGGGAARKAMLRDDRGPYSRAVDGFATMEFQPGEAIVQLLDADGKPLHVFTRTKAGTVTVTLNTPSEPRTTQPLKLIQGFDVPPTPIATQPAP
jgi:hypothetical protein